MRERFWRALAALVVLPVAGCGGDAGGDESADGLWVHELRRSRLASLSDTIGPFLEYPVAMTLWRDSIVVADMRAAQIVVLPSSLQGGRAFGVEGEGPGELRTPQGLAATGDRLAVFDRGNARVSWYGQDGEMKGSRDLMIVAVPFPHFVALEGQELLVPIESPTHYATLSVGDQLVPRIERPEGAERLDQMPFTSNMIVDSPVGRFMIDAENGLVFRIQDGDSSSHLTVDSLPTSLRNAVAPTLDSLAAPELRLTPIIAAGASPDGLVVWLTGKNDPAGGLLRAATGAWVELRIGAEVMDDFPEFPLDVLVADHELFVLTSEGLLVYALREGG